MKEKQKCVNCYCEMEKKERLCERCRNKRVIEWVNVKDQLPEKDGEYLIFRDNKTISIEDFKDKSFPLIMKSEHGIVYELYITHWADISRLAPSDPK